MNHQQNVSIALTADTSALSVKEEALLLVLINAARLIHLIYLRQSNQPQCDDKSFDRSLPKNFYPKDSSVESVEEYLAKQPEARKDILNPFTVVVADKEGLRAIPYSQFYKDEMEAIAQLLAQAATLTEDTAFRHFLRTRSTAFRTNQFRESDIAWINANNGPFELTIGPYESYTDTLFNMKRTFECFVGVILPDETRVAGQFQEFVSKFDAVLGDHYGYRAHTTLTPMVVMNEVYASGEARLKNLAMAYNLPNDTDIHEEVGSKKVFIDNVMRAKFETLTLPIARRVLTEKEVAQFDFDCYRMFIIGHESAHGLSFRFEGDPFGPLGSAIEECKADVFGMWFMYFLADQGMFSVATAEQSVIQHFTDFLRQIRFGPEEAHAVGAIIQFNWCIEHGALMLDETGLFFDASQFREAIVTLGDELYTLAKSKDKAALERFAEQWGKKVPKHIPLYLTRFADLPVDIDPIFEF